MKTARQFSVAFLEQYFGIFVFFCFSVFLFGASFRHMAFSGYFPNIFDGYLRLLPQYYIRNGFIPLKDFESVYPPGQYFLIGQLIPFTSPIERNLILAIGVLIFLGVISWLFYVISRDKVKTFIAVSFLFLLNISLVGDIELEPFFIPLFCILVLLNLIYLLGKMKRRKYAVLLKFFLFSIPLALVFFRWERISIFMMLQIALLPFIFVFSHFDKIFPAKSYRLWLQSVGLQVAGVISGLALLLLYMFYHQALQQGIDYVFLVPMAVMDFRTLPLPKFESLLKDTSLIYVTLCVYAYLFIWLVLKVFSLKHRLDRMAIPLLCAFPLIVLPYMLWRPDIFHMLPQYFLVGFLLLLIYLLYERTSHLLLLFIFLFIPIHTQFIPNLTYNDFSLLRNMEAPIEECRRQIKDLSTYKSMFVGRITYDQYLLNYLSFYFLDTRIKPATPFIADEPGIQNDCGWGEKIVKGLETAQKPMLAFLEQGLAPQEPNKTATMKSCKKIESYLGSRQYLDLGSCSIYYRNYSVRAYF